jgi:hypothetical protein
MAVVAAAVVVVKLLNNNKSINITHLNPFLAPVLPY